MIESIKKRLGDLLERKKVALAMIYDQQGNILWHKGRAIKGAIVTDGEGFSKSSIQKSLQAGNTMESENVFITISGEGMSRTAQRLKIKNLMILPLGMEMFLYADSGDEGSFSVEDRQVLQTLGALLGEALQKVRRDSPPGAEIIGCSAAIKQLEKLVSLYAGQEEPILLLGETGTGKSHVARVIYESSGRSGPMILAHTPSMPESLFESEMFGHEKEGYTGAYTRKTGLVAAAEKGTLFFDEIAEVPVSFQAKLLNFVESKRYRLVGGTKEIAADIHIIFATHRDIRREVAEGRFREDLFYRMNVLEIQIPPLRQRKEDIRALVQANLKLLGTKKITPEFWAAVMEYDWPGNVRELLNVLKRAGLRLTGSTIGREVEQFFEKPCRPEAKAGISVCDEILKEIGTGKSFWDSAWELFLKRDLNRREMRTLLERCYANTGCNLKEMSKNLNIKETEYPRFISYLHKYNVHPKKD